MVPDPFGKKAPLRLLDLTGEQLRRELVRFVKHDEVPVRSVVEKELKILITTKFVEPRDHQIGIRERVAGSRALDSVSSQEGEIKMELLGELCLPLLNKRAGGHNKAAPKIAPNDQLANEQSR